MDIEKLRALALAATQGEWQIEDRTIYVLEPDGWRKGVEQFRNRFSCSMSRDGSQIPQDELLANARFVAAACPATVLALIAEVERLRADAERYRVLRSHVAPRDVSLSMTIPVTDIPLNQTIEERIDMLCDIAIEAHTRSSKEQACGS